MDLRAKYLRIMQMSSVYESTKDNYPTWEEFNQAIEGKRIVGNYKERIVILSDDLETQYRFVTRPKQQGTQKE
jgi:hypothetical protein